MGAHKYLLGVDFGGGGSKATLLREDGAVISTGTVEIATSYPAPGFAEQNPDEWCAAFDANCRAVLRDSGVDPGDIACVALDGATHTAVLADESGTPLRPAIYWTDSRSTSECAYLRENYGELINEIMYHSPDTIWTLPQLMWLRAHEPETISRTKMLFFAKDYVRYRLTGVHCTDSIEAEGSMLFDYRTLRWSEQLLELAGVDSAALPRVYAPDEMIGAVTADAAERSGLRAGTPVIAGATDTVMELFASGAVAEGQTTVKLATAGRICVVTRRAFPHKQLINYSHVAPGLWYPGTATKSCAASLRWYRDAFGGDYAGIDRAAADVPTGCGGLMFHPYLNGELTPYADPSLCGSFTGVRSGHDKAWFDRAVLEGVAYSLRDCVGVVREAGMPMGESAAIIGGGAKSPLWRGIVADMLGLKLVTPERSDSSLGSAMLAGVGAGIFSDVADAVAKCVRFTGETLPNAENTAVYESYYPRYRAIHDALAPVYHAR